MNEIEKKRKIAENWIPIIIEIALKAARQSLVFFRKDIKIDNKKHPDFKFNPVTDADRKVEQYFRQAITENFPEHAVEGEEYPIINPNAEWKWIIDPIDGTKSFVSGTTGWATLIGLLYQEKPLLGIMVQPFIGELFYGNGKDAFWKKDAGFEKIQPKIQKNKKIEESIILMYSKDVRDENYQQKINKIQNDCFGVIYGNDCYAHVMAAMGVVDAVVEVGLQRYDIIPLIPIIKGIGAEVKDWNGNEVTKDGNVITTSNEYLLQQLIDILKD